MLRAILIYLSKSTWARMLITHWIIARRAASRFVAGETLDEAIQAIRTLNAKGINATLDHLGENTTDVKAARQAAEEIKYAINAIQEAEVRANVSVKLTQIGLKVEKEVCAENLRNILKYAEDRQNFTRIDMEDSTCTEATLELYGKMWEEGFRNTGIVIQSYLFRSEGDIQKIVNIGGKVRLCKGAYKEPHTIAFPQKKNVDLNFDKLSELIIDGAVQNGAPILSLDGRTPPIPAIATHDPQRLFYAKQYAREKNLPSKAIEFQMLYGIRRDLQEQTVQEGYPVRVYVPYGTEWYPYFMRRLAERPANLWFFISNYFRK